MTTNSEDLFLLLFRSAYLSMMFGFAAFTCLGFARLGTAIGLIATVTVALGSEAAFFCNRWECEKALKVNRHIV
jgi:hypothetical protein